MLPTICLTLMAAWLTNQPRTPGVEYVYVEDLSRRPSVDYYDMTYFGNLDATGQFVPDHKTPPRPTGPGGGGAAPIPLMSAKPGERLYAYYSGRLVPGVITTVRDYATDIGGPGRLPQGVASPFFYPDLDGKVIEFSEYLKTYDPQKSRRIYNLPGRIVKKSEVLIKQGEEKK